MSDKCTIELKDKAKERYEIKRSFNYGKELNVYKAYERNNTNIHYVIKSYKTKEGFERELQMLKELSGAKNITQMVDNYPEQSIIVCECALYDLETFLGHQDYIQRHEEKGNIIKDIVSGLLELQKHNIVHTELSPGNIMFFQENNGCVESWKLIDFDTACFASSYYAKIKMNYSAPEVIRAQEEGIEIKADFSMDMFSFGLVLYFIETGRHYWDGWDIENEEVKREIISGNKYSSLLQNIRDQNSCWIIKSLLVKDISHRMKLDRFMRTPYYTGESKSTNVKNFESDYEINEELFQLYQSKFTQLLKNIITK
uniref:Protein kinase domain-containing protein n=1 Tax=Rhizophagus irregularis (strain DAOM 181602 / DAOM 197198 / MUCL 43194) TaxID=747089 RepID=U9UJP5_RHIID